MCKSAIGALLVGIYYVVYSLPVEFFLKNYSVDTASAVLSHMHVSVSKLFIMVIDACLYEPHYTLLEILRPLKTPDLIYIVPNPELSQ